MALVLCGWPAPGSGQKRGAVASEPSYDALITEAVDEFDAGHWREARALFLRAHRQRPSARTLRGLGFVEFELRHYTAADELLRKALAETHHPLTDEQRREVDTVLARVGSFLGRYRFELEPAASRVLVDGAEAPLDADGMIVLEAGEHQLSFSAPSHRSREQRLDVRGGERITLRVELQSEREPATVKAAPQEARDPQGVDGSVTTRRIVGWSAVGLGAVGAGLGIAFALDRSSKLSEAEAICPSGDCGAISMEQLAANNRRIGELTDRADSAGTLAVIGLAAGGTLMIGGLLAVLTAPDGEQPDDEQAMAFTPQLAPGRLGFSAAVRWH